jgi:hypothetical protein
MKPVVHWNARPPTNDDPRSKPDGPVTSENDETSVTSSSSFGLVARDGVAWTVLARFQIRTPRKILSVNCSDRPELGDHGGGLLGKQCRCFH